MSIAIAKLRGRIRVNLMDEDGRMASPTGVQIDMAIADAYIELASMLPPVSMSIASALTIAAGGDTFSLPVTIAASGYGTGTTEYGGVELQLVSSGQWLTFRNPHDFQAIINGQATLPLGVPHTYTLYEGRDNVLNGRCTPGAKVAEACNLFAQIKADDLRDYVGVGGAEGFDTVTAPLSREGSAALVLYASAYLLQRMGADSVAKRGINPSVADQWLSRGWDLLYGEAMRKAGLEGSGDTQQVVR